MDCIRLTIDSYDCEDFNDSWEKDDVEFEMRELGCEPSDSFIWIDWVLDHCFESKLDNEIVNAIKNINVRKMNFKFDGYDITLTKVVRN